jgi:hypothetical protein
VKVAPPDSYVRRAGVKRPFPIHPLLFALSPVLFLYSHNIANMPISSGELALPAAASVGLAVLLLAVAGLVLRDRLKAGIITSVFLLLFSVYGGVFSAVGRTPAINELARHQYLIPAALISWLLCCWLVMRVKRSLNGFTVLLNAAAAAVVLVNVGIAVPALLRNRAWSETSTVAGGSAGRNYPDIYYIILDGYTRSDILRDRYGCDNSQFIRFLKSRGFSVAARGRPNYASTYLSLASSLNFMQLDSLAALVGPGSANRGPLTGLTGNSRVASILKQHGYKTVCFASGFLGTEFRHADRFLSPRLVLSEFQNVLLATTPLPPLVQLLTHRTQYDVQRGLLMFQYRMLPEAARGMHPAFVFCHTLTAHPPFVFGPHGEKVNPSGYFTFVDADRFQAVGPEKAEKDFTRSYCDQINYLDSQLEETVDRILASSPAPPIIIIQGDHGRPPTQYWDALEPDQVYERMAILNACLFPGDTAFFYDSITPVNTFRLVFNRLFGDDYPLLPDKSYFSTMADPYVLYDADDPSSWKREAAASSVNLLIFTTAGSAPPDPEWYGRRVTSVRFYGENQRVDAVYIRTVPKAPSVDSAIDLYRSYVRSEGLPDLGDTCATYSGRGPKLEPVTALFFPSTTRSRGR